MLYFQFLGSLIKDNDVNGFESITPEYLIDDEVQAHEFTKSFIAEYKKLPSKDTYKSHGFSIPLDRECEDPSNYYVSKITERYKIKLITDKSDTINEKIGSRDLNNAVDLLQDLVSKLHSTDDGQDAVSVVDELRQSLKDYEDRFYNPSDAQKPVSLGFEFLDKLNGGAYAGNLIGFLARPSIGKTSILMHVLLANWQLGTRCLVASGEMTRRELVDKLACYEARLDCNKYLKGSYDHFRIQKIQAALDQFGEYSKTNELHFLDPAGAIQEITIADIERSVAKHKPRLLVIDAVYLFKLDHKQSTKQNWDKVSATLNGLKSIANRYNLTVLCTGQIGKQAENKKGSDLDLTHAADTDTWGKICNMVIGITKGETKSSRKIVILKNRIGPGTGDVNDINYKPECYDFSNFVGTKLDALSEEDAESLVFLD